jgi:hypothetical protein
MSIDGAVPLTGTSRTRNEMKRIGNEGEETGDLIATLEETRDEVAG